MKRNETKPGAWESRTILRRTFFWWIVLNSDWTRGVLHPSQAANVRLAAGPGLSATVPSPHTATLCLDWKTKQNKKKSKNLQQPATASRELVSLSSLLGHQRRAACHHQGPTLLGGVIRSLGHFAKIKSTLIFSSCRLAGEWPSLFACPAWLLALSSPPGLYTLELQG